MGIGAEHLQSVPLYGQKGKAVLGRGVPRSAGRIQEKIPEVCEKKSETGCGGSLFPENPQQAGLWLVLCKEDPEGSGKEI